VSIKLLSLVLDHNSKDNSFINSFHTAKNKLKIILNRKETDGISKIILKHFDI
jgi:hypothetical protein